MFDNTVWEFNTARFRITLELEPEDMDPADSFDLEEDIEAVRSGAVDWFCAKVAVYFDGVEIAADYLGGCAYANASEFYTAHRDRDPSNRNTTARADYPGALIGHYFPDMVRDAIAGARIALAARPYLRRN